MAAVQAKGAGQEARPTLMLYETAALSAATDGFSRDKLLGTRPPRRLGDESSFCFIEMAFVFRACLRANAPCLMRGRVDAGVAQRGHICFFPSGALLSRPLGAGEGGYGEVFQATMPDGAIIAVKRMVRTRARKTSTKQP